MLPAIIVFFLFYPDGGGYQYGPRYWFAGWVTLPLTLAAGLGPGQSWRLGRWLFDPIRIAGLQVAAYAGFTLTYAIFAHAQVEKRQEPLRIAASAPAPAMVLIPDGYMRYVSWQVRPIPFGGNEFTRNGPDGFGPVVLARDLGPERTALLCKQIHDRTIWRLRLDGASAADRLESAC